LKEEALDSTHSRYCLGRDYGLVSRRTTWWWRWTGDV